MEKNLTQRVCAAIRNIYNEDLGVFEDTLVELGFKIRYFEAHKDSLEEAFHSDLCFLLGGPISVNETNHYSYLNRVKELAHYRIQHQAPTVGLCLGAQLLAQALGGRVVPNERGVEIGWLPISLSEKAEKNEFAYLIEGCDYVMHWHGEKIELPSGVESLASSERCEVQAFQMGTSIVGFQFHPEFAVQGLESWLIANAHELSQLTEFSFSQIREDSKKYGASLEQRGQKWLCSWLGNVFK